MIRPSQKIVKLIIRWIIAYYQLGTSYIYIITRENETKLSIR